MDVKPLQQQTRGSHVFPRPHQRRFSSKPGTYIRTVWTLILLLIGFYVLSPTLSCIMHHELPLIRKVDEQSVYLPYVHKNGTRGIPLVNATIDGVKFELPVDTGSTGLLIGAPLLPDVKPNEGIPVHHYFTSSNILYKARLVERSVTFHGAEDTTVVSRVPVLVVDESFVCPWYNPEVDTFDCPKKEGRPPPVQRDLTKITYMGVGFGRNRKRDGMPAAIPRNNPFLNLQRVNGRPVSSSMGVGYTISRDGVHLGLTAQNTTDFKWTDLKPGLMHHEDPRDWSMLEMCFTINSGSNRSCGSALIDTGIEHMYLRAEPGVSIPNVTLPNPKIDGYAKTVKRVRRGTGIKIGFPSLEVQNNIADFAFSVGDATAHSPSYVVPLSPDNGDPYVNTGRNFLFSYDVAFDAIRGRFGFRKAMKLDTSATPPESDSGGSREKTFDARL